MRIERISLLLFIITLFGISLPSPSDSYARWPTLEIPLREWNAVLQSMPAHPLSSLALNDLVNALPLDTTRTQKLRELAESFPDEPLGLYALDTLWTEAADSSLVEDLMHRHPDSKVGSMAFDLLLADAGNVEQRCAEALTLGDVRVAQWARVRLAKQCAHRADWSVALLLQLQAFIYALEHDVKLAGYWYPALAWYYEEAELLPLQSDWAALMVADLTAQRHAALRLLSSLQRAQDLTSPLHALISSCNDLDKLAAFVVDPSADPECRARGALALAHQELHASNQAAFLSAQTIFLNAIAELRDAPETYANLLLAYLALPLAQAAEFDRSTREQVEQGFRSASIALVSLLNQLEGDGGRGVALRAAKLFEAQGRSEPEIAALQRAIALGPSQGDKISLYKRLATVQWMLLRDYGGVAISEVWLAEHMEGMAERELAAYATAIAWYLAEEYGQCMESLLRARENATVKTRDRLLYLEALVLFRKGRISDAKALLDTRLQDLIPNDTEVQMRALSAYLQFAVLQESDAMAGYLETLQAFPEDRVARTLQYFLGAMRSPTPVPPIETKSTAAPNVLLISVDTMRADHLASLGYPRPATPNIDTLASRGVLCERAYSTSSWTKPAHASVFTGLYPQTHGAMKHDEGLQPEFPVMAETLQARGYTTLGVVSAPPLHRLFGFARGFQHYDDQTYLLDRQANLFMRSDNPRQVDIHSGYTSTLITESALRMLELARSPDRPFFLFVNYFDAHHNYLPPAPVAQEWCSPYAGAQHGEIDQWNDMPAPLDLDAHVVDVPRLRDLYSAELRHVDDQVGRLLNFLRDRSLLEDTIVVIFSDHGEEFLEHGHLAHGRTLHNEVIHVPLIFAGPGVPSGERITSPVSLVDLFPTLLQLLGMPPQEGVQGMPLLEGNKVAMHEDRDLFAWLDLPPYHYHALISNHDKLVRDMGTGNRILYDLLDDPGETRDDTPYHPEVARHFDERLEQFMVDAAHRRSLYLGTRETRVEAPQASLDEIQEQLRALGYVSP